MFLATIPSTVILLVVQAGLGYASPVITPRAVNCDDISKYTVQYFLDNKIYDPPASTCLFYTAGLSGTAQRFAHGGGDDMTTIWDIWPCNLYQGDTSNLDNPLRCIFSDKNTRTTYFEHMSEAMAVSCDNFATVMTKDTSNIPQDGIWGRIEQEALKRTGNPGGQVDTIVAVDQSGGSLETVWERPGTTKPKEKEKVKTRDVVEKRGQPNGCLTPEQIDETFGDVPW